ncbi:MAG: iron-containing alcohol dehydrogenase [Clostridia bacterium]|nr:iron-containing alcohol dehydrogenase [Clostridia bacterium]MDE7328946.1 iron-containing alcohol dehydrogenase [Clostridia bacterium]
MEYNFERDIKFMVGDKALRRSVNEINGLGCRRILLICDEMSDRVGQLKDMLRQFNGEVNIVEKIKRIKDVATVEDCEKALRAFKASECDSIIALGKKSAVAVAKAVKIMLKDGISIISNYRKFTVNNISALRIPLIVVPTNLSSGVEASNFVRIYDKENNDIFEFNTSFAQTNLIAVDPIMTDTMPPKSIATSGLHALAMAVMSLTSDKDASPLCEVYSVTAIKFLTENLKKCILQNKIKTFRFRVLLASILAGYAYWQSPKDIVSELSDRISDRYRANYGNIFLILFLNYIKMHKWDGDFDPDKLINLLGDNAYLIIRDGANAQSVVVDSVDNYYRRLKTYVDYVDNLEALGAKKEDFVDIASSVISMHADENEEYTFSFISELLEKSFSSQTLKNTAADKSIDKSKAVGASE